MSYWAVTDQFVVIEFEVVATKDFDTTKWCRTRLRSHSMREESPVKAWWKEHFWHTPMSRLDDRSDVWNSEVGAVSYAIRKLREKKAEVVEQMRKLNRQDCALTQRLSDAFNKVGD